MATRPVWLILGAACGLASLVALAAEDGSSARPRADNVALGKTVLFGTPPNYPATTDPDDASQLVDGKLSPATPMWYDTNTVGWALVDPTVFTIDLGAVEPICGVGLHIGAGQAGAEWPGSVHIYISDDGASYSHVGDLMELLATHPPETGYASFWLLANRLQTRGRFVRFVCSPVNLGNGAYIMLDEVEIYRGDAAWLDLPLPRPHEPEQWRADWQELRWDDCTATTPHAERPTHVRVVDGDARSGDEAPLQQAACEGGRMRFSLLGEAGRARSMSWTAPLSTPISTARCRYALLTYRAEGIRRTYAPQPLVQLRGVSANASDNDVTLLEANMALNDGLSHTLLRPLPEGFTLQQLKVTVVTESDAPRLILERLELQASAPEVYSTEVRTEAAPPRDGLVPVGLGAALNGSLSAWHDRVLGRYGSALDGVRSLPAGNVEVSGVPFAIPAGETNLALMPEAPEQNERVEFLGQTVDSRNLGPISRDDALSVDVDASACEAYLLLALAAPPIQPRYGVPSAPLRLDDIECLAVELTYDRGEGEVAFPYSLADRGCCIPARELGAYAVAVDPTRRLKRITLHNHQFGQSFALAGVTLNTSAEPLLPDLATFPAPERAIETAEPPARPVEVTQQGRRLTFSNRWYECGFDLSQGFALDGFTNRYQSAAMIRLGPGSGLRVRVGDTVYTGRCFAASVLRVAPTEAELRLTCARPELPLEITVTVTADDSPELRFAVQARNLGDKPLEAELCLPALDGLSIGDLSSTRLFFPQYRTVDTAQELALRAPYGPEFAGQFMDVYSRPAGIGLMLRTDNPKQRMATFALAKTDGGVAGGVWFPAEFDRLDPGTTRSYPAVSLLAHGGDWHSAFALYRDWVRSWYRPDKSQDEAFFLSAWDIQCHRLSDRVCWREARVPAPITADRKRWFIDETFALEQKTLGHVPDLLHFYNWTYNDREDHDEYGVFGSPLAYEQVGGLDFFREGIARIQQKWQCPVSLYTINDRFRLSALPDQALARELAGTTASALEDDASAALRGASQADGVIFPQFGDKRWTDYIVDDLARMQRDTGCQVVYMDVMPRFSHLRSTVGVSPREDDIDLARRMREALPDEVALWSEYPFTDVASQYVDGCLQYYFVELCDAFARRYNGSDRADGLLSELPLDLGRFALTRYRTICLPAGIEGSSKPSQVDAVFVNGEVFHENTYAIHCSRPREKINRSYAVKHEYTDCFQSDGAMPRVDTAAAGITANLFPGESRNLWTLYNGRPRTYSGVVLTVPHKPGARYRDAWNGQPLTPAIDNGMASISLSIDPQQPGCVVQDWSGQ